VLFVRLYEQDVGLCAGKAICVSCIIKLLACFCFNLRHTIGKPKACLALVKGGVDASHAPYLLLSLRFPPPAYPPPHRMMTVPRQRGIPALCTPCLACPTTLTGLRRLHSEQFFTGHAADGAGVIMQQKNSYIRKQQCMRGRWASIVLSLVVVRMQSPPNLQYTCCFFSSSAAGSGVPCY
jgi:hypothetical protein